MSDFSQRYRSLSPEKKALLARELKKKGHQFNFFPLSFAQQRLWLLDQLEPGNPSYNISTAMRFVGHLHVAAFERSLQVIVQRHESLRTTFVTLQGQPVQMVMASSKLSLPRIDLSGLTASEREPEMQRQADSESLHAFQLAKGPLLRIKLFRLSESEHVAILNIHHIVSDGWSTSVLLRELAEIYSASVAGRPPSLPPLPIQYSDYAVWQRNWLQGDVLAAHLAYWRQRLGADPGDDRRLPEVLALPTDRPRPAIQTYRGSIETLMLGASLSQSLRDMSRKEGVTLFMTLLAIFQILLSRYSGQEDIVVGAPIANRNRAEIEGLIGFFVNSLALRSDLSGNPSFHELLMRVRKEALGAYAHQDLPFDKLVEELSPERNLSHTPLFQVYFNMINLPVYATTWPGLTVSIFAPREAGSKFDLTLYATDGDEGILLELLYNTDLFDQARMYVMLQQFAQLASQVLDFEQPLAHLSLVTPAERAILPDPTIHLGARWGGSVQCLFTQQAERRPGGLAVVDASGSISYQELDALSNRLAHYVRASGIARAEVVAIYAHRSLPLIVAMLGVLKAGAACLILDPAYPPARLIEYLAAVKLGGWLQIQAAGSLATEVEEFLSSSACRCQLELPQRVSDLRAVLATYSAASPDIEVGADDLAFVTFTSGSTGQPKGVLQRHGPLAHFSRWQQECFGLEEAERYSLLSGLAHDPLQREIFTPLSLGGSICIPSPEYIGSPGWLAEWMQRQDINIAHLTPAMLQLLTQSMSGAAAPTITLAALRYAFTGGEALTRRDVSRLYALAPTVTCVNLYGSTESHRALGYFVLPRVKSLAPPNAQAAKNTREIIPLGQGIEETQLLVLNAARQLAGISELGEMYVRSPHLATGYVNDAALTRERFISNPFTGNADDRLYRTGDLGRYRPDGTIEYAGRNDQQVKLRGFRIELAEIEAALRLHPAVGEAIVIVREDTPEQKRLVAYVVATQTQAVVPPGNELRDFLAARLPAYMLPAVFVPLDVLPMTPNRKVDRRALPIPESVLSTSEPATITLSATQEILAGIWARMLGRENVGVDENFFDIGGHSLLATQLLARVYEAFQLETPLRTLFETPTVAGLAAYIEQQRGSDTIHRRQVIQPQPREHYHIETSAEQAVDASLDLSTLSNAEYMFPLSFAEERLWFLDQLDPGNAAYTIQVHLHVQGKLNIKALQQSIYSLAERHETLRTTFVTLQGRPLQAIARAMDMPIAVLDLGALSACERQSQVQRRVQDEAQRAFDLARGPLFSLTLLRLSPEEHLCLFSIHHSIADAWSIDVFFRELNVFYTSALQGNPAILAKLPIQYADYAVWQRQWLQGDALAEQLAYWKAQLANAPAVLELPSDHPRPALQSHRGARWHFELPLPLTRALVQVSRQHDVTLYMTLLAAFQTLLCRYSGQQDILVGTPIAGRTAVEVEGLIGLFINTLVMRGDLSGDPSFSEVLKRVREVALAAYAQQDLPFEKLVEELQPERNVSYSPLFQVMFILQNTPNQALQLADLTVTPLEAARVAAQYDLTLVLWQEDERLQGYLAYSTDLFEAPTIERMAGHLQTLLEGIVTRPDQRISQLPLLPASERRQMLIEWNATQTTYPLTQYVHTLFEVQAERALDGIAVVHDNSCLTYGELNRRANALANFLRKRRVGRGSLVALCVERSLEMLVALLGILKSGAAYVPLDPTYPRERLAFMLSDSHCALLLTQQALLAQLPTTSARTVLLDVGWSEIAGDLDTVATEVSMFADTGGELNGFAPGCAPAPPRGRDESRPYGDANAARGESGDVASNTLAGDVGGEERATAKVWPDMGGEGRGRPQGSPPYTTPPPPLHGEERATAKVWPNMGGDGYYLPPRQGGPQGSPPLTTPPPPLRGEERATATGGLAYVIYTSGSTGQPKGVQISHRALVNFLCAMLDRVGMQAQETLLAVTSLSFDIAGLELYLPLVAGGRVHLASQEEARDGRRLADLLSSGAASIMQATPATWRLLLEAGWSGNARLRILCGGEALPPDLARQLLPRGAALWNLYGPTETTIWSLVQQVQSVERVVHIGRPLANTQVYLLDAQWQLVPIGVHGDLYIGGVGLADGYLHRPDLTAERFLPDPFSSEPGTRLYHTGDRARYLADGVVEFLGRTDQQIKLRGYRIELGEIEAALAEHPNVRQSVAMLREDAHGESRLVVYVVPREESSPTHSGREAPATTSLRSFLAGKLPEYMLPSAVVHMAALPLTPNGKVDRKALPAPEQAFIELAGATPRTPIEELLAQIWMQVLRREQIGLYDNFFELGGHSLLATQLLARIRDSFQVEISLRSLFMFPTVAGLAQQLEAARTAFRQNERPPLIPGGRNGQLPLSFAQQRLWFMDQWESGSLFYNIPLVLRFSGILDVAALQQSFTEIVRRHEALRTTFVAQDGQPLQIIQPPFVVPLPVIDLQEIVISRSGNAVDDTRDYLVHHLAETNAQQPFDLSRGPLLKMVLLRADSAEHILLLTMHHIIADGWSIDVLVHELRVLYAAFVGGNAAPLPALTIQYADYTVWQRQWLQGDALAEQLAYWKAQLANAPAVLELPSDHPRPALQSHRGARWHFELPLPLTRALVQVSRQHDVTLYMTLLAAFQTLLCRYSGQQDILVGTPIAGRTAIEVEGLIGLFINTLVMRGDLSGDPSFSEVLKRVREVALAAYAQQDLPFEKLVEELQPERNVSYSPLFQVMFILQNTPNQALQLADLTVTPLRMKRVTAQYDLTLVLWQEDERLEGHFEYNTDLFEAPTIERMAGHLQTLLEGIVTRPDQRISLLPLLSVIERQQMLVEWNATQASYPRDANLHHLFETRVEYAPEAIAVRFEGAHVSYGELNQRANALARHLLKRGAGPGTLVALCVERSLEMLVGVLGILKTGAAFVPLDPAYPKERLAFMLADAQAPLLLTQQHVLEALPASSARTVLLDAQWGEIDGEAHENLEVGMGGDGYYLPPRQGGPQGSPPLTTPPPPPPLREGGLNLKEGAPIDGADQATTAGLAYVIYTSGSTGQPKGVLATHRATINRLQWMWERFPFEAGDVGCQKTSLSFVDSIWELFGPLLQGISSVMLPDAVVKDPPRLVSTLAEQGVTRIVLVPSLLQVLLESTADLAARLPHGRMWISSGEALPLELAERFLSQAADRVLLNLYGSSEVAADATYQQVRGGQEESSVPIGRPIANTQVYVLDGQGQPVPIGVPGEVYIGGAGLAWGYLQRPELTAERFVPLAFSREGGERLYRTGDLARYRADGTLVYLGRRDRQVKIRGYRIETQEIEAVLAQHPAVGQVVVVMREEAVGDKRLVAYVVAGAEGAEWSAAHDGEPALTVSAVRTFLQGKLPEYMLPSAVVLLPTLPLTPNGKIDWQTLPAPQQASVDIAAVATASRPPTPVEEVLMDIWAEVLRRERIGVDDNFFELGGHSLLATQVIARVRTLFQVDLSVLMLFEAPTVASFAESLIEVEPVPGQIMAMANVRLKIKRMSPEEVRQRLRQSRKTRGD